MITIACVYRSGGDFAVEDVAKFSASIRHQMKAAQYKYGICCLTDRPQSLYLEHQIVDEIVPLEHDWPGWWPKIELFNLSGPVIYFDLDTRIVAPIDGLLRWASELNADLLMVRDFYKCAEYNSSIMAWNHDLSELVRTFAGYAACESFQEQSHGMRCGRFRGDQDYIQDQAIRCGIPLVAAQSVQRGIYSYKVDVQPSGIIPEDASVICFHGRPRPSEVTMPELPGVDKTLSIPGRSE